jgi:hypothetical protein
VVWAAEGVSLRDMHEESGATAAAAGGCAWGASSGRLFRCIVPLHGAATYAALRQPLPAAEVVPAYISGSDTVVTTLHKLLHYKECTGPLIIIIIIIIR